MDQTEYDFIQTINSIQLLDEIAAAGLTAPTAINTADTAVAIMYAAPLSDTDAQTLSTVVANHVANPAYVSAAVQAQINTLTAYLNNANPAIVSLAMAAVVSYMAGRLPPDSLAAINAIIHRSTGA